MKELIQALCAARKEFKAVPKNGSMEYKGRTHSYATLGDYISATQEALAKNGVYVLQFADVENRTVKITTRICHTSGESLEHTLSLPMPGDPTPQAAGSAITYGKRYSIAAMLYLDGEVDEDGNVASNGSGKLATDDKKTQQPKKTAQNPVKKDPPPLQPVYAVDRDLEITEAIRKIVSRVKPDISDEKFLSFAKKFEGLPRSYVVGSAQQKVDAWSKNLKAVGS